MAKSLERNVIIFDGTGQEYTGWWKVEQVIYRAASSAGDTAILQDSSSNVISEITASSANQDVPRRLDGKWCDGVKCTALPSGSLEIHVQ